MKECRPESKDSGPGSKDNRPMPKDGRSESKGSRRVASWSRRIARPESKDSKPESKDSQARRVPNALYLRAWVHFGLQVHQGIAAAQRKVFEQAQRASVPAARVQKIDLPGKPPAQDRRDGEGAPVTVRRSRQLRLPDVGRGENIPRVTGGSMGRTGGKCHFQRSYSL